MSSLLPSPLLDPAYYLEEGCGLFALACLERNQGQGSLWVMARRQGEAWSERIPYEVTHAVYRDPTGQCWDARGPRDPARMAQDFGLHASQEWEWKGPFSAVEFLRRFMGNHDSQPLFGTRADVRQLAQDLDAWWIQQITPQPPAPQVFELVKEGWQMQGTSWHAPGDGWLVAHDVYHHEPHDQGTFAEELMSFGVQEWLESAGRERLPHRDQIDFENAVCYVLSESKGKLTLPPPPPWPSEVSQATRDHWRAAYTGGLGTLVVDQHKDMDDPAWAPLDEDDHVDKAIGWMAEGWRRAQVRYPHPAVTQAAFDRLEHTLNTARITHPLGTRLTVTWQSEGDCHVDTLTPRAELPRRRRMR